VVSANQDRVDRGRADTGQGKYHPKNAGGLDILIGGGLRVIKGSDTNTQADGDKYQGGVPGDGGRIEDIVDDGRQRREENATELIEHDG